MPFSRLVPRLAPRLAPSLAPIILIVLSACATPPVATTLAPVLDPDKRGRECVAVGSWMNPQTRRTMPNEDVINRAAAAQVVLMGETHVMKDHHRWHLQTVAQIYLKNPDMVLGLEAFPRRVQGALDRWVAGELTEQEFLDQSEWQTVWRYDPDLYMPLFQFARMNAIPMVALNVDRQIISQISELGWDAAQKSISVDFTKGKAPDAGYIEILKNVFGQHDNGRKKSAEPLSTENNSDFARFVDVQVTWDRAFAHAIANTLSQHQGKGREPVMVNIIGRGHTDYGFGVSHQLEDLGMDDTVLLSPWDDFRKCADLMPEGQPPVADAVFGTLGGMEQIDPPKAKLGVYIEQGDGGVRVMDVVKESVAAKAGIRKDDVVIEAAGKTLTMPGELINIVQQMPPGAWLPLKVRRGSETIEMVARFAHKQDKHKASQ